MPSSKWGGSICGRPACTASSAARRHASFTVSEKGGKDCWAMNAPGSLPAVLSGKSSQVAAKHTKGSAHRLCPQHPQLSWFSGNPGVPAQTVSLTNLHSPPRLRFCLYRERCDCCDEDVRSQGSRS